MSGALGYMPGGSIDYFVFILIIVNDLLGQLIIFLLVVLYGYNIIRVTLDYGLCYIFLASHHVNCSNVALEIQRIKQQRDSRNLIAFIIHLYLS